MSKVDRGGYKVVTVGRGQLEDVTDFKSLVAEMGYVRARRTLKQRAVDAEKKRMLVEDAARTQETLHVRLQEALRISSTLGDPFTPAVALQDKDDQQGHIEELEEDGGGGGVCRADAVRHAFRRSLLGPARELNCAQMNMRAADLPAGLGDTLAAQLGDLEALSWQRNSLASLLSPNMPQLSMHCLRSLRAMNVSGNQLTSLPPDIGVLGQLVTLDASRNSLSRLPASLSSLGRLQLCRLAHNNLSQLDDALSRGLTQLREIDLSHNLFSVAPFAVSRVSSLRSLDLSSNSLGHLAFFPPLMRPGDLWELQTTAAAAATEDVRVTAKSRRQSNGSMTRSDSVRRKVYRNILTGEEVENPAYYDGRGIEDMRCLHCFQGRKSHHYGARRTWLSVCQVQEWDAVLDPGTGWTFFRNNVSGESAWDMPDALDALGGLRDLEVLRLSHNKLRSLPRSLVLLRQLHTLLLANNRLGALLRGWDGLHMLSVLHCQHNELKLLPVSLEGCACLTELNVQGNLLSKLPDGLGYLPHLAKLNAAGNALTRVPPSLGYASSLAEVCFESNPLLTDPSVEVACRPLPELQWFLRQRLLVEQRGAPPEVQFHRIGIRGEVTVYHKELDAMLRAALALSERSGLLNLQLMGLRGIPAQVLALTGLLRLRLDFNEGLDVLRPGEGMPSELRGLKLLSMRACGLTALPGNIHHLKRLTTLRLEENSLEALPKNLTRMRALTALDVSKNRLYTLPAGFESLEALKSLNLSNNCLSALSPQLGRLQLLHSLNLDNNRLEELPAALCSLAALRTLNLCRNALRRLPSEIRSLSLTSLRIDHNLIEQLDDDIFDADLGGSLRNFSCHDNNLQQLPQSLVKLSAGQDMLFSADSNPLVSPPPPLLALGLTLVQQYMWNRDMRRRDLFALLAEAGLEVDEEAAAPVTFELLVDGAELLFPVDLRAFDSAVHEFLNGEFYLCPASAEEIVDNLVLLRERRRADMYRLILNTFLTVVAAAHREAVYGPAVIMQDRRPYGKDGASCTVWVVSLNCVLQAAPPNQYQKQGRASLLSRMEPVLAHIPFPFTAELFMDAVKYFEYPYGVAVDVSDVLFPACDCVHPRRGTVTFHPACRKSAVVIAQHLYTDEEAERQDRELLEIMQAFARVEEELDVWLQIKEGREALSAQVDKYRNHWNLSLSLNYELLRGDKKRLQEATARVALLQDQMTKFQAGRAYVRPLFKTLEGGQQLMEEAARTTHTFEARIQRLQELEDRYRNYLRLGKTRIKELAVEQLKRKYCFLHYHERVLLAQRRLAAKLRLDRPWDGEDGAAFKAWCKTHYQAETTTGDAAAMNDADDDEAYLTSVLGFGGGRSKREIREKQSGGAEQKQEKKTKKQKTTDGGEDEEAVEDEGGEVELELVAEYGWEGCDEVDEEAAQFRLDLYDRYRRSSAAHVVTLSTR